MSCGGTKSRMNKLQHIEEEKAADRWLPATCPQPETPTESMEFLARSWSLSAMELSKALCNSHDSVKVANAPPPPPPLTGSKKAHAEHGRSSLLSNQTQLSDSESTPLSPRVSDEAKELFLLHQALNPEFLSNQQQLLRNGQLYRSIMKRKTTGRWIKDQKDRKKQEIRAHKAQLHAAISVAAVAAVVASLAASSSISENSNKKINEKCTSMMKSSPAIASAAALVASHCIEIAEDLGADHDHILSVVNSAINARTNGDVMTLTAGAATALRGAATLRARLNKEQGAPSIILDESITNNKDSNISVALNFVFKGGELLKRTRKGDLHWKRVSFNINSNWQVVAKMKSKHMGGTFTKKKKCIVCGVVSDIPAWPGREKESEEQMGYFAIQTADRVIQFECRNKTDKQIWIEGIQNMLHLRTV